MWTSSSAYSSGSGKLELFDGERVGAVVAVTQPARPHPHMCDVRAGDTLAAIWVLFEVGALAAFQILAPRQVGRTLTLKGYLVVPADHQRDPWARADVAVLTRRGQGIEHDLALLGRGDAN